MRILTLILLSALGLVGAAFALTVLLAGRPFLTREAATTIAPVLFVAAFLLVVLLFLRALALDIMEEIQRLRHFRTWPAVMARIDDVQLTGFDSDGQIYSIHVTYQYRLPGALYSGSADISGEARESAAELRRSYHIGEELPVVYNPDQPAQSAIADARHNDLGIGMIVSWVIGIVIAALMIGGAVSALIAWLSP